MRFRNLRSCSCTDYQGESIDHLLSIRKPNDIRVITVRYDDDDEPHFTDRNGCDLITDRNIVRVSELTQEGAALMVSQDVSLDCVKDKVDGDFTVDVDYSFLEKNGVKCPICYDVPDKVDSHGFLHYYEDYVYKCTFEDFFVNYCVDASMGSFTVGNYRSRMMKGKRTDGPTIPNFKRVSDSEGLREHNEIIEEQKSKIDEFEQENSSLLSELNGVFEEMDKHKRKLSYSDFECEELEEPELIEKMEEMVEETAGRAYVYCLVQILDNDKYYYVGKSINPTQRLSTHLSNKNVINVAWLEGYGSEEKALEMESVLAKETSIREGTVNVLGGR